MNGIDWRYGAAKTADGWFLVVKDGDNETTTWLVVDPAGIAAARGVEGSHREARRAAERVYEACRARLEVAEADMLAVARAVGAGLIHGRPYAEWVELATAALRALGDPTNPTNPANPTTTKES